MKSIFRGTTPLLRFSFPFEYSYITNLTVSFAQDGTTLFKISMGDSEVQQIEDGGISIELTEEEMKRIDAIPYCGGIGIDPDEVEEFG